MHSSDLCKYQNWLENLAKSTADLVVLSSRENTWTGLDVAYLQYSSQQISAPAFSSHLIVIHPKPIPRLVRKIDAKTDEAEVAQGQCSIIPAGLKIEWQWEKPVRCRPLHLALDTAFVRQVAIEDGYPHGNGIEIINQFTVNDQQINQIGLALKTELELGGCTGRLFGESLATALATRLLRQHSTLTQKVIGSEGGLARQKLQLVTDYINDHLNADLRLTDIAALVSLSSSQFTRLFKQSMGVTPYQYVIQCRVERARLLLLRGLTIGEIAILVGFSDQSHLTYHFKLHSWLRGSRRNRRPRGRCDTISSGRSRLC